MANAGCQSVQLGEASTQCCTMVHRASRAGLLVGSRPETRPEFPSPAGIRRPLCRNSLILKRVTEAARKHGFESRRGRPALCNDDQALA
jgi:hypothetical protein